MNPEPSTINNQPPSIREEHIHQLQRQFLTRGELKLPCVPARRNYYLHQIEALLQTIHQTLGEEAASRLSHNLALKLEEGFEQSPRSLLVIQYDLTEPPEQRFKFNFSLLSESVSDTYQKWVNEREPPLFGSHPDAKLMAIAAQLGEPAHVPVLDIGAAAGRNTLPLAKLGYPVDAVELAPVFVNQLQTIVQGSNLPVRVILGDILSREIRLRPAYYRLVVLAEVVASHIRDGEQLRLLLAKVCDVLCSGGLLLFSMFLTVDDYEPDPVTHQISQAKWSCLFTRKELAMAMERLPIELVSDESVFEYEREHLPEIAWPPTSWFINWCLGYNVFPLNQGRPPLELRWVLCRRL